MTEQQIKQNAMKMYENASNAEDKIEAYIAGAHSRDEEIEELHQEVNELSQAYYGKCAEVDQLRNPWISVEERLPEVDPTQHTTKKHLSVAVLCWDANIPCDSLGQQYSPSVCKYDYERKDWLHVELGYYENEVGIGLQITHWMTIPQVPKGGEK